MSGGYFDYDQYKINEIASTLERKIASIQKADKNECEDFTEETIEQMKIGLRHLKIAFVYAQRIDWLLSADDGENTFHSRLMNELRTVENEMNTNA